MKPPKLKEQSLKRIEKDINSSSRRKRTKEDWRSLFALIILVAYFIAIGIIVVKAAIISNDYNMIELLNTVGSLIGTPLGFVIGYYYKNK